MTKNRYIQNPDGKMAGSIGQGRDDIPRPAPVSHADENQIADQEHTPTLADAFEKLQPPPPEMAHTCDFCSRAATEVFEWPGGDVYLCASCPNYFTAGPPAPSEPPCLECDRYGRGGAVAFRCCPDCHHCLTHCTCGVRTADAFCETCGSYMGHGRIGYPWLCFSCNSTDGSIPPSRVTTDVSVVHIQTSATKALAPTDEEREVVARAVDDFFDRVDAEGGASVIWKNDHTGEWQVVDREGIQRVWVAKRFDYCTQFTATDNALTFVLESGHTLQALRTRD